MSFININHCNYYYEMFGSGEDTLVFMHGILWNSTIFEKQIDYFKSKYTILVFDHRNHGQSEAPIFNSDIDCLFEDSIQLLDHLGLKQVHLVGISMGADIALRLTIKRPDLVKSLVLLGASAQPESNTIKYKLLINIVRFSGIKTVLEPTLINMFGHKFLNDPKRKGELERWTNELLKNKNSISKLLSAAIKRKGIDASELKEIDCPTLLLTGTDDKPAPYEKAEYIHNLIKKSKLKLIEDCGHLICIEDFKVCNTKIELFLKQFDN